MEVLGHTCEGLAEFKADRDYGCFPDIRQDGIIKGCNAESRVPIKFCPFCAALLDQSLREEEEKYEVE